MPPTSNATTPLAGPAATPRSPRMPSGAEDGFGMVEVMVSATLVAVLAIGMFAGLDTSAHSTARQRAHTQAQQLAQQDEDRLRAMRMSELSNLNQTQTITLDGIPYTVNSTANFVRDSTNTASCASGSATADYLGTTSTVTWPNMGTLKPVVARGIVSPPNGSIDPSNGALAVEVLDSRGRGVGGMNVAATGAGSASGQTSDNGCVIFGNLPGGDYTVTASKPGYVDSDGNSSPPAAQQAAGVVAQSTSIKSFQFDVAGTVNATFQTSVAGVPQASSADTLVLFQTGMTGSTWPNTRVFGTQSQYLTALQATSVFPFTSPYSVYAGSCPQNAPSANGQASDPAVTVPQGGTVSTQINLPALNLTVYSGTSIAPGSTVVNPRVVLTDNACGGVVRVPPTTTAGTLQNPGQPYSSQYRVCADNGAQTNFADPVVNNDPVAGTTVNIYLGDGTTGTC